MPRARPSLTRTASEESSHDEVFEIQDFTNATNWEKFISLIEETIRSWNITTTPSPSPTPTLTPSPTPTPSLHQQQFTYAGRTFLLQYHIIHNDINTTSTSSTSPSPTPSPSASVSPPRSDHTSSTHLLHQWFGVTSFLLFQSTMERRISHDESRILLSTLMVAVENCQCPLPVFVPIDDTYRSHFIGRCMTPTHHIQYDTRSHGEVPPGVRHLSGLTDWFQEKTKSRDGSPATRPLIAASYSYSQSTQDWDYQQDDAETCVWRDTSHDILTWGSHQDPLAKITLKTSWPYFPEGTFVDNAVYSDLDPLSAPNWIVSIEWTSDDSHHDPHPLTSTFIHFHSLIQHAQHATSMNAIVGLWQQEQENKATNALAAMTVKEDRSLLKRTIDSTVSGLKQHMADAERVASHGQAVTREWCQEICDNIWNEKKEQDMISEAHVKSIPSTSGKKAPGMRKNSMERMEDTSSTFKTSPTSSTTPSNNLLNPPRAMVPYGSLLSQLVIALCTQHSDLLTLHSVALLWSTFIARVRMAWDTCTPIPHLMSDDIPHFGFVLIHQKLQLLQRCIRMAKNAKTTSTPRYDSVSSTTTSPYDRISSSPLKSRHDNPTPDWHSWNQAWESESEDDTPRETSGWGDLEIDAPSVPSPSKSDVVSGWDVEVELDAEHDPEEGKRTPEGVAGLIPDMFLLLSSTPMACPHVQEHTVMTQDQFEEHQELFARLGSSEEATKLRAELQGASLLSDMQSFRAANPGCLMEDFVRWHSPADWKPSETSSRGMLSQRMRSSTNIWQRLWRQAKPCPATKQKPLFDYQSCGERIMNYLETVLPSSLLHQLTSIAYTNAYCILSRTDGNKEHIEYVHDKLKRCDKYITSTIWEDSFLALRRAEQACARAASLLYCFPFSTRMVNELMYHSRSLATNRRERSEILEIFATPQIVDADRNEAGQQTTTPTLASPRQLSSPECVEFTLLKPTVPSPVSGCGPRLYARISEPLFRVATTWHTAHA